MLVARQGGSRRVRIPYRPSKYLQNSNQRDRLITGGVVRATYVRTDGRWALGGWRQVEGFGQELQMMVAIHARAGEQIVVDGSCVTSPFQQIRCLSSRAEESSVNRLEPGFEIGCRWFAAARRDEQLVKLSSHLFVVVGGHGCVLLTVGFGRSTGDR